jgi:hypothetical protein
MTEELQMARKSKRQVNRRSKKVSAIRGDDFNPDYTAVKKRLENHRLASKFLRRRPDRPVLYP